MTGSFQAVVGQINGADLTAYSLFMGEQCDEAQSIS